MTMALILHFIDEKLLNSTNICGKVVKSKDRSPITSTLTRSVANELQKNANNLHAQSWYHSKNQFSNHTDCPRSCFQTRRIWPYLAVGSQGRENRELHHKKLPG